MIYAKLDWYTVMLYNTTIQKILGRLNIDYNIYEDLLNSVYERSYGFQNHAIFSIHGVSVEIKWDDYIATVAEQGNVFDSVFSTVRLDISGSGLDYLRSLIEVDSKLLDSHFWGSDNEFKITRSDFAFDFVNYQGDFLDNMLNWIKDQERSGNISASHSRLNCGGSRAVMYSYRCGDQKTLYLGSSRGDKLVRIYDKLLQYSKNGVLVKELPEAFADEGEVKSWFRIEFQTRRKSADTYLFGCNGDLKIILGELFREYRIQDQNGNTLECIVKLYNWETLPPIIQNAKFAPIERVLDKSVRYVTGQARRSIVICMLKFGVNGFVELINNSLKKLYLGSSSSSIYGHIALNNQIAQMCEEENIDDVKKLAGCNKQDNYIFIKREK